ncbi:hypothetical protein CW713_05400 [Methanophagales archaeon]|nr:MAG: hypothetical protein CW714_01815 [Methanophagales archaeon]RJS82157.1 MAG: hypothetical protein CW713_05400 [Methanophagales archaeon]
MPSYVKWLSYLNLSSAPLKACEGIAYNVPGVSGAPRREILAKVGSTEARYALLSEGAFISYLYFGSFQ